jgi:hypothetical protein
VPRAGVGWPAEPCDDGWSKGEILCSRSMKPSSAAAAWSLAGSRSGGR